MAVITDPAILESAALLMFRRLTQIEGELVFPCVPSGVDEILVVVLRLLKVLTQHVPEEKVILWRDFLVNKLTEGQKHNQNLVFRYEPYNPAMGITEGFQLHFTLHPPTPTQRYAAILQFPCIPALSSEHLYFTEGLVGALGQEFTPDEHRQWRETIEDHLAEWFTDYPESRLVVHILHDSGGDLEIQLTQATTSLEHHYQRWTQVREGPLFGSHPDAKVLHLAQQLDGPILDIGAGTGRNSLALAQLGYEVTAVELTHVLVDALREAASQIPLQVLQGDIFDPQLLFPPPKFHLVFYTEVVPSHCHTLAKVRQLVERSLELLEPGGYLLFNTFLAVDTYEPSPLVQQLALVYWCFIMTRKELATVLADLPVVLCSDESVTDYEQTHLPPEAWPPTTWFEDWATGRNLFPIEDTPPIELRWLLYRYQPPGPH
jgi:2-polyprenyl-3-methyl-5-hydroxy-6-metoxy-1,4-benzoquinol methylase